MVVYRSDLPHSRDVSHIHFHKSTL